MQFTSDWHDERILQAAEAEQATYAALGLEVGEFQLLRNEDLLEEKPIRPTVNVSLYPLARWFVANWWRLRWEAALPDDAATMQRHDWIMSHSMGATGRGYYWPDVRFISDTQSIRVQHVLHEDQVGSARYLQESSHRVPARQFENAVFELIEATSRRLSTHNLKTELHDSWHKLQQDLEQAYRYRQLEAQLGFDTGEAETAYINQLLTQEDFWGKDAIEELAQAEKQCTLDVLNKIKTALANSRTTAKLANIPNDLNLVAFGQAPWRTGEQAATALREYWQIDTPTLSNNTLAERLELTSAFIHKGSASYKGHGAAHRTDAGKSKLVLGRARPENRRFMLARLIGDVIYSNTSSLSFISTDGKTYRQKFQRAFAQSLLCPYETLKQELGHSRLDEDTIKDAAASFGVSQVLVYSLLRNKGDIPRDW